MNKLFEGEPLKALQSKLDNNLYFIYIPLEIYGKSAKLIVPLKGKQAFFS